MGIEKAKAWDQFKQSGKIEDYLRYFNIDVDDIDSGQLNINCVQTRKLMRENKFNRFGDKRKEL